MAYLQTLKNTSHLGTWLTRRRKANKRLMAASLMLTPMVDMFSLLVIFLLQFFSTSPDFQITKDVRLPNSMSSREIELAPSVSISMNEVFVDKVPIGALQDVLKDPASLSDALLKSRAKWVAEHPNEEFQGNINLEAHEDVESTTIAQIMMVLSAHHFGSINLVALGGA